MLKKKENVLDVIVCIHLGLETCKFSVSQFLQEQFQVLEGKGLDRTTINQNFGPPDRMASNVLEGGRVVERNPRLLAVICVPVEHRELKRRKKKSSQGGKKPIRNYAHIDPSV